MLKIQNFSVTTNKNATETRFSSQIPVAANHTVRTSSQLTAHHYPLVAFTGRYDPLAKEYRPIIASLRGKGEVFAHDYFPAKSVVSALYDCIHKGREVGAEAIEAITHSKACVTNANALTSPTEIRAKSSFIPGTHKFIDELKTETAKVTDTMRALNMSDKEIDIFHMFAAETTPILHNLGFPDAIGHASQVTRKSLMEVHKIGGTNQEKLQAALVGWLHDPKVPWEVSPVNLATHPVVGSAIAHHILTTKNPTEAALREYFASDKKSLVRFKQGLVEALLTNNDSKFVLDNVILPNIHVQEANEIALSRFFSPSQGKPLQKFPRKMEKQIEAIQLDTGIKTVKKPVWEGACASHPDLSGEDPSKVFKAISNGEITNPDTIQYLRGYLQANNGIASPKVTGLSMFCHHDEVKKGTKAALALTVADPMLLSPHKIMLSRKEDSPLERITSYIDSFRQNVAGLPLNTQENGRVWHKDLLHSMISAADELTGKKHTELPKSTPELEAIVKNPETWGEYAGFKIQDDPFKFQKMVDTIKQHYEAATESSTAMFKAN